MRQGRVSSSRRDTSPFVWLFWLFVCLVVCLFPDDRILCTLALQSRECKEQGRLTDRRETGSQRERQRDSQTAGSLLLLMSTTNLLNYIICCCFLGLARSQ
jgi:hypothetical protein